MLENFKKAILGFYVCVVCLLGGGGLMAEPNPKELFNRYAELRQARFF
ncbi:hypothetical protein HpM067_05010 [Helicobacter pylori]